MNRRIPIGVSYDEFVRAPLLTVGSADPCWEHDHMVRPAEYWCFHGHVVDGRLVSRDDGVGVLPAPHGRREPPDVALGQPAGVGPAERDAARAAPDVVLQEVSLAPLPLVEGERATVDAPVAPGADGVPRVDRTQDRSPKRQVPSGRVGETVHRVIWIVARRLENGRVELAPRTNAPTRAIAWRAFRTLNGNRRIREYEAQGWRAVRFTGLAIAPFSSPAAAPPEAASAHDATTGRGRA